MLLPSQPGPSSSAFLLPFPRGHILSAQPSLPSVGKLTLTLPAHATAQAWPPGPCLLGTSPWSCELWPPTPSSFHFMAGWGAEGDWCEGLAQGNLVTDLTTAQEFLPLSDQREPTKGPLPPPVYISPLPLPLSDPVFNVCSIYVSSPYLKKYAPIITL